jgi:hypothetical protein
MIADFFAGRSVGNRLSAISVPPHPVGRLLIPFSQPAAPFDLHE